MLNSTDRAALIQHPILGACKLPSNGRLKWLGGNLALDYPVCNDVLDSEGKLHSMGLDETLKRIDEFEGYRCDVPIKDNLIASCFTAYKYNQLTNDEKVVFEKYIHDNISKINTIDAAQILMLNK